MNEFFAWLIGLVAIVIPGFGARRRRVERLCRGRLHLCRGGLGGDHRYGDGGGGQVVAAGQVLFTLGDGQYRAGVAAAEAGGGSRGGAREPYDRQPRTRST